MRTIIINLPEDGPTVWDVTRAVLEAIEPGASRHCLSHDYMDVLDIGGWTHHRLGVSVSEVGGP